MNQRQPTEAISEERSMAPYVDGRWIHEAAERRTLCERDGSSARGVDSELSRRVRCSEWNHQPKSRMREIRTSGSVRGLDRSIDRSRST